MAEQKIGNAYLEVVPKVSPSFGSDLKSATQAAGASAGEATGHSYGTGFSAKMQGAIGAGAVFVGNTLSKMADTVVASIGDVFAGMFNNFADYEQLVGGVDTLFKESSAIVQANAENAFKTAGLSANQYMEQVTSFSASLLQGLGGDTEKAAAYADMAIQDMSDNANKMGTSMESIQNAYQGFAKQNYTMLDNLKLGYGGTKTEMERLLADASEIAGVEFSIDNYNDVIEAIHVMQTQMDITGTTMKEGSTTITGSMNQMHAAWANFLTAVGDGGRSLDLTETVDALLESVGAMLSNAIPTIGRIAASLVMQLPSILYEALQSLPSMLQGAVTDAFGEGAGEMFAPITEAMENLLSVVDTVWPTIQTTIGGVLEALMSAFEIAWPFISDIVVTVSQVIQGVVETVWPIISGVVETSVNMIKTVVQSLQPLVEFVTGIFDSIKAAMENPIQAARDFIKNAIEKIKGFFNFQWKLPDLKLPHIVVGEYIDIPVLGRIPNPATLHVEWYGQGGYVDGAHLIGAGENGGEMIWPSYEPWLSTYADALAESMSERGAGDTFVFNITADSETTLQSLVAQAQRARIAYGRA